MNDFKVEEIQAYAEVNEGIWIASAFIDRGDVRTIISVRHGKKKIETMRSAIRVAIQRINDDQTKQPLPPPPEQAA